MSLLDIISAYTKSTSNSFLGRTPLQRPKVPETSIN